VQDERKLKRLIGELEKKSCMLRDMFETDDMSLREKEQEARMKDLKIKELQR